MQTSFLLILVTFINYIVAEDRWVWTSNQRQLHASHEVDVDQSSNYRENIHQEIHPRNRREREPTTRKPVIGSLQNDDIDDYVDNNPADIGTRNYPYSPNGYNAGQALGFNSYPNPNQGFLGFQPGNAANGILVGPGGPTGLAGRPQQSFPGLGFGEQPGGYPAQNGIFNQNGINGAFPGQNQISNNGFPIGFGGQQYPQSNNGGGPIPFNQYPLGQYPQGGQFIQGGQFPLGGQLSGQYPAGQGGQYATGQFPGAPLPNVQHPGSQYPPGQYSAGGPSFTEGYGLAYTNGFPPHIAGPYGAFGSNAYGTGFDDINNSKKNLKLQEKSLSVESTNSKDKGIDDKVSKTFKSV